MEKAESVIRSSGFIVPLRRGQSLRDEETPLLARVLLKNCVKQGKGAVVQSKLYEEKLGPTYFLLVLICPTCPQLAHFRWVPTIFGPPGVPASSDSPAEALANPFCFSRAKRRSLFLWSRPSSASSLKSCQYPIVKQENITQRYHIQFLVAGIHFRVAGGFELCKSAKALVRRF